MKLFRYDAMAPLRHSSPRPDQQQTAPSPRQIFESDPWVHYLGGFVHRHPRLFIALGNLETRLLEEHLAAVRIEQPVFVAGLARSGSTMLLEVLSWHPQVGTHRYRDDPLLHTPFWWNRYLDRVPARELAATQRSHHDGILVTPESPEAFEEVLWMSFFPHLHDPHQPQVLDASARRDDFADFFKEHIRKLLAVRGRRRYAAKGNYNVTRLGYLADLFPDARFVIPVRDPVWHVASLMKQHELFSAGQRDNPRARAHLRRIGHFEFGLDRQPIHTGEDAAVREVLICWNEGREVEGWARYWSLVYGHVADTLERSARLREAAMIVRYDALCRHPGETVRMLYRHCALSGEDALIERAQSQLHGPTYYQPRFSRDELHLIRHCTQSVAARFGILTPVA